MIDAWELGEMEDRAAILDPDDIFTISSDVLVLVNEVRRLREIETKVMGLVADKREAADEYFRRVESGDVAKKYGYRRCHELMAESNYIERVLK